MIKAVVSVAIHSPPTVINDDGLMQTPVTVTGISNGGFSAPTFRTSASNPINGESNDSTPISLNYFEI